MSVSFLVLPAGAATYFYTRGQHPHVETNKAVRTDALSEERDSAAQEGHEMKESIGRRVSRCVRSPPAAHGAIPMVAE